MSLVKVSENEWRESAPNAEYRVMLVEGKYKVFRLNFLIGGGITLDQAKEIIAEDIDERYIEDQRQW